MARDRHEPTLLRTSGDEKEWIQIECGDNYTAAITKKGELLTWGWNDCGQLGHCDKKSRNKPKKVTKLDGSIITQVSCGAFHTVALTDRGEALTWYVQS